MFLKRKMKGREREKGGNKSRKKRWGRKRERREKKGEQKRDGEILQYAECICFPKPWWLLLFPQANPSKCFSEKKLATKCGDRGTCWAPYPAHRYKQAAL